MSNQEKAGELFEDNSTIGKLFFLLKDGKSHTMASLQKAAEKGGAKLSGRLNVLRKRGKRTGLYELTKEKDSYQLTFTKGTPKPSKAAPPKASTTKTSKKSPAKKKPPSKGKPKAAKKKPSQPEPASDVAEEGDEILE